MSLLLVQARIFANLAHATQRYGTQPYVVHLDRVVELLKQTGYGDNEPLLVAGYLHDILEDTSMTTAEVEAQFGEHIRKTVELVTDPPGVNRKERKAKLYQKLADQPEAMAIKLADRCANLENCLEDTAKGDPRSKLGMYFKEKDGFEALRVGLNYTFNKELWKHLDFLFSLAPNGMKLAWCPAFAPSKP